MYRLLGCEINAWKDLGQDMGKLRITRIRNRKSNGIGYKHRENETHYGTITRRIGLCRNDEKQVDNGKWGVRSSVSCGLYHIHISLLRSSKSQ